MHYFWGPQEDGSYATGRRKIKSQHKCTSDELGVGDEEKSKFMPTLESEVTLTKTYQKKFHCIGEEDMYVFGEFNSNQASLLNIQLRKCNKVDNPDVECKPDEEILEYFRNKFVLIKFNQVRFEQSKFGPEAIVRESKLMWNFVNTQAQVSLPHQLSQTQLYLQDAVINLDDLTELADASIFKLDQLPSSSYEKDYSAQFDFTVQINPSQIVISRDGYTFLDLLSDIGGI